MCLQQPHPQDNPAFAGPVGNTTMSAHLHTSGSVDPHTTKTTAVQRNQISASVIDISSGSNDQSDTTESEVVQSIEQPTTPMIFDHQSDNTESDVVQSIEESTATMSLNDHRNEQAHLNCSRSSTSDSDTGGADIDMHDQTTPSQSESQLTLYNHDGASENTSEEQTTHRVRHPLQDSENSTFLYILDTESGVILGDAEKRKLREICWPDFNIRDRRRELARISIRIDTSDHPLFMELDRGLNEVLESVDPYWVETTLLPLRKHYLRVAYIQIFRIVSPVIAIRYSDDAHVENIMNESLEAWSWYSQIIEKALIALYNDIQDLVLECPKVFESAIQRHRFSSKKDVRKWLYEYFIYNLRPIHEKYLFSEEGVTGLYERWSTRLNIYRTVMADTWPQGLPIFEAMQAYQPRLLPFKFFKGDPDVQAEYDDNRNYGEFWLPEKVNLPTEDMTQLVLEYSIPFSNNEAEMTRRLHED